MPVQKKRRSPTRKPKQKPRPKSKPKRPGKKNRRTTRKPKRSSLPVQFLGVGALVLIVLLLGFFAYLFFSGGSSEPALESATVAPLKYEIFPEEKPPAKAPAAPATLPQADENKKPLACIIIDDMGYDRKLAKRFLDLDAPLTFSMLPFSPFQEDITRAAEGKGMEIMLHLPMEPDEYPRVDPGPGALLTSMSPDELIRQLTEDIRSVPGAKGVNNHMGSRMTSVSSQMHQVFSILKKEGLFFIDSRTTVNTLCKPSARLLQVPFAERDIFLDHVTTADFVRKQILKLMDTAEKNGRVVGIGHPHEVTVQVLDEMMPELRKRVRLVPASMVVGRLG